MAGGCKSATTGVVLHNYRRLTSEVSQKGEEASYAAPSRSGCNIVEQEEEGESPPCGQSRWGEGAVG